MPGAHLLLVSDMGHDLPEPLWPLYLGALPAVVDLGEARSLATTT